MAVISKDQMDSMVREALDDVRAKAKEAGIKYGIAGFCFTNASSDEACFDDLMPEEDRLRIFTIVENGSCIIPPESNPVGFTANCFGLACIKIAAVRRAYEISGGKLLTSAEQPESDNILGRHNMMGCVLYPVSIDGKECGSIAVICSGGTGEQDELCAWSAYDAICRNIAPAVTSNPGREKYFSR